jgi:hypothetical protein
VRGEHLQLSSVDYIDAIAMLLTVWLRDGKFEQPKGGNSECRSLHFEMTDGDLNGRFYGREHVIFALICTGQRLSVNDLILTREEDSLNVVSEGM